jgi:(p)ppGpp synthase/HD superfamily hydrolase
MTFPEPPIIQQIAQTHLQLFQQMRSNGYSTAELTTAAEAYRTATKLFADRFRPCGRPFVSHLIGTSAILVWLKAPMPIVIAAMLHAAYQEGDFANSLEGMTPRKRKKLRAAIGLEAEELVAAYTLSSRSLAGIRASYARFNQMSSAERDVLLMQLANELDDYRDLASNHAANADERIAVIRQCGSQQAEMAEWLGQPTLAQALRETYAESIAAFVPKSLLSEFAYGYEIVPNSCQVRYNILARRLGVKLRNRLRRHLGLG